MQHITPQVLSNDTYIYPTYETRFAVTVRGEAPIILESKLGFRVFLRSQKSVISEIDEFIIGDDQTLIKFDPAVRDLVLQALTPSGGRIVVVNGTTLLTDDREPSFMEWHPALAKWNWSMTGSGVWTVPGEKDIQVLITSHQILVMENNKTLAKVTRALFSRYWELGHIQRYGFTLAERLRGDHLNRIHPQRASC